METQCIVLGNNNSSPFKKKIKFECCLIKYPPISIEKHIYCCKPSEYKFIELITLNYSTDIDLMFAYNDIRERFKGILYLGHWNDGVV